MRTNIPALTDLAMKWVGLKTLARHLGWMKALWFGIRAESSDDPFRNLKPPGDEKERLSRLQIVPAIKMYRTLEIGVGKEEALKIVGDVVFEASLVFLERTIGPIDIAKFQSMENDARKAYLESLTGRFPNATNMIVDLDDDRFTNRISHCHFVDLCKKANVQELAPLFCHGDLAFFSQGPVALERPTTLAEGGSSCDFQFTLRQEDE